MAVRDLFPETSWTLLAKARERCDDGAEAREIFSRRYYRPVQVFLRVLIQDSEQARDLAQEFFAKLAEPGGLWEHIRPGEWAFRDYLQQCLRHLVIDYHRRNGKYALHTHPDQAANAWEVLDLPPFPASEASFHCVWVKATLVEALQQVRALCRKRKQQVHLELFESRYLSGADLTPSWTELGARYGMDQRTARERADTVARHFRLVLRRMLRNEIRIPGGGRVTDAAIDEEIQALLSPIED